MKLRIVFEHSGCNKMYIQGCHFTWKPGKTLKNLEFDNLDKKTWNLRNFEKYLKKPGISNKNH